MFFDSAAKHVRIRLGDIHDFRSQTVASHLPNLNNTGEPRVLGNVKINPHSVAYIHGRARQQAQTTLAYFFDPAKIGGA
jgi:hypothetical protein